MKEKTEIGDIIAMFNADYGIDIEPRLKKLNEELNELKDALYNYFEQAKSGKIDFTDITDGMGDVLAVMTHVCSLIGTDPRTLFFEAVDKIKRRKTDPNYKRTHPHIKTLQDVCESGDLCNYCSYIQCRSHYPGELCEGNYCEEAYDRYCEEMEENE